MTGNLRTNTPIRNSPSIANVVILATLMGLLASILGYQYGTENHIELLPIIKRAIDSSYLSNDFYTNAGIEFGPRFYFVKLIAFLANHAPLSFIYFALTLISNILIALITALFARDLFGGDNLAGILASCIIMSVQSFGLGGGQHIHHNILVPVQLAMPFVLAAMWAGIQRRPLLCAMLAGVGCLIHPQLCLETGTIVLAALTVEEAFLRNNHILHNRKGIFSILKLLGAFLVLGAFAITWLRPYLSTGRIDSNQFINIIARFRHPHHFLPSTFSILDYLMTVSFLIAGGIAWHWWQRRHQTPRHQATIVLVIGAIILLLCIGGYLFVEVIPTRIWTTAQTFRLLVLIKWLGLVLVAGLIASLIQSNSPVEDKLDAYLLLIGVLSPIAMGITHLARLARSRIQQYLGLGMCLEFWPVLIVVSCVFLTFSITEDVSLFLIFISMALFKVYCPNPRFPMIFAIGISSLLVVGIFVGKVIFPSGIIIPGGFDRYRPILTLSDLSGDEVDIADYARHNTPKDAAFLTPPSLGQFRFMANRAIVVDFKTFLFQDYAMVEWQRRLFDCYGVPSSSGYKASIEMDDNYREIDESRLYALRSKYDISYAVLYEETLTTLPVLFASEKYKIVVVPDEPTRSLQTGD